MSFTKAPDANPDAKILAKKPPETGGSASLTLGAGGLSHLLLDPQQATL